MKLFIKAKPYPDGTIRSHAGKKYRKQDGGWIPVKEGMSAKEKEVVDMEAKKNMKNKLTIKNDKKPVKGTKEIYDTLHKVHTSKDYIYLDDMKGKNSKIMNVLTKEGLVKWEHVAHDEYKASLTQAGQKAHDAGHAYFHKVKRESLSAPKSKVDQDVGPIEVKSMKELFALANKVKDK